MRAFTTRTVDVGDLSLAVHERPGRGVPVVLVHATGLTGRTWDPVVEQLPADLHVIAPDLRGHGESECPEPVPERFRWRQFGEDIARVIEALDLREVTLVGHSMGGHSATVAALETPERIARLVLFDPTLTARPPAGTEPPPVASQHPARRRRNEWGTPDEFYESLRTKPPFASWSADALRAYAAHGLRPQGDGYVLACPPLFEASVYAGRDDATLDEELPWVRMPVHVTRARPRRPEDPPGLGPTATRIEALELLPEVRDRQLADASHFFPLESPDLAAEAVIAALADDGGLEMQERAV